MVSTLSYNNEWHDRFLKESEENTRLRAALEETRAKYDVLLEASLQQMASRIDEFSATTEKLKRMSPTNTANMNPPTPTTAPTPTPVPVPTIVPTLVPTPTQVPAPATTSSNNLTTHAPLTVAINDDSHGSLEKQKATPKKKFGGLSIFKGKEKPVKAGKVGFDEDPTRSDFVLPLAPSTSYQHLPRLQVLPLSSRNYVNISGPTGSAGPVSSDMSGSVHYSDVVAGRTISTYPHIPGNPNRDGDPIADRYAAHVFENRVIASVADGCNWGVKPREAAQKATAAFIEFVNASYDSITDVKKAGAVLLSAFEYAHNSIMEGKLAFWDAGTTTLLGGILLEINKNIYPDNWTPRWEFLCASVGDCKAFCYSNGEITDITHGNRQNANDPRDCGGRLGPHLEEGKPDLRNLNLFCAPCLDGDLIIITTDGVYDNMDPQHLGRVPKDMPKEFNLAGDSWDDVDSAKAIVAKNAFTTELLLRLLKTGEEAPTPKEVADRLVTHCIEVTQKSRDYMENNQGRRLPEDYVEFPGKMDHTTVLCFRVGRINSLPENVSSPSMAIASTTTTTTTTAHNKQEDETPRVGSPTSNPKGDWTKISPSIKHS